MRESLQELAKQTKPVKNMKYSLLISLLFLLTACAAKKLVVNHADTLLEHQIEKRIPLYSAQKERLAKAVDQLLEKEKPEAQKILPVLDDIPLNEPKKLETQISKVEALYRHLSLDMAKLIASTMADLDMKQQKDFFANLKSEDQQILDKGRNETRKDVEAKVHAFLGSLTDDQKKILLQYSDYFESRARARVTRREILERKFMQIYSQDVTKESRVNQFYEAFKAYQDDLIAESKVTEIVKKMAPTLTKEQREQFRQKTAEVKEMLNYFIVANY